MTNHEFTTQFKSLDGLLYSFAYKLTNNTEEARDLVQETAFKAYGHIGSFRENSNFKAWLTIIMRNTFITDYRKRKRRNFHPEPIEDYHFSVDNGNAISNVAESNLMMEELQVILAKLDPNFRKPFMMYYKGFKYEEIANEMELPVGTVKSRIFFARKKLRQDITAVFN